MKYIILLYLIFNTISCSNEKLSKPTAWQCNQYYFWEDGELTYLVYVPKWDGFFVKSRWLSNKWDLKKIRGNNLTKHKKEILNILNYKKLVHSCPEAGHGICPICFDIINKEYSKR